MKLLLLSLVIFFQNGMEVLPKDDTLIIQDNALNFVSLFDKYDGNGYPVYNWYLQNKSKNKAIRVNVKFWNYNNVTGESVWTKSFDLEPGDLKNVESKTVDGVHNTNAQIVGARFL